MYLIRKTLLFTIGLLNLYEGIAWALPISECGYLTQASATYTLQNDVSSSGTCFTLVAPDIVLDLNGHTITYDNGEGLTIPNGSFESELSTAWDTGSAPNTTRSAGSFINPVSVYDGDYALKVLTPSLDQVVTSVGQITLAPNKTYSLSAMVYNQVSDSITVAVQFNGTSVKAAQVGKTVRGFHYINATYTTGASTETYAIRITVTGAGAAPNGSIYIDDVRVQGHRYAGIMIGPLNWRSPPRVSDGTSQYGAAPRAVIKNGKIVQGSGLSQQSHGLIVEDQSATGFELSGLEITTKGANSRAILLHSAKNAQVHDNIFNHAVLTITSRDNYDGASVFAESGGYGTQFYSNTVASGVQTWLYARTNPGAAPHEIHHNDITLQTRVTNGFAIVSAGSKIFNNFIHCGTGNNSCRGIWAGGITGADTPGTKVYNNTVEVQQLPRNQEYNGCEAFGAYGIQMQGTNDAEVYGNVVTAYADLCEAHAFRVNPDNLPTAANNLVHDNTFRAIANGAARASSVKLSKVAPGAVDISSNTMITNRRWIYVNEGTVDSLTLTGNTWQTAGVLDEPFHPFEVYTWDTPPAHTYVINMVFRNNRYANAADEARFKADVYRSTIGWPNIEPNSNYVLVDEPITLPDSTPPSVSISSPVAGSIVKGSTPVSATASDDIAVARVEFYLDGVLIKTATVAPYSFNWNTLSTGSGMHVFSAKAYDEAGNVTTSNPISVHFRRIPKSPVITGVR